MIRPAGINDIDAIISLEAALFDNPMSERMLRHELTRGRGWIYGEHLGYVLVRFDSGLTDITRLGVRQDRQGRGIGKALLDRALLGVPDAILTVKKDNVVAMKLYAKYGFNVVAHLSSAGAFVLRRTVT
jgi:ribosomal-protein-alanine N-acetyltransferase